MVGESLVLWRLVGIGWHSGGSSSLFEELMGDMGKMGDMGMDEGKMGDMGKMYDMARWRHGHGRGQDGRHGQGRGQDVRHGHGRGQDGRHGQEFASSPATTTAGASSTASRPETR
eukprot:11398877-Heterocapsa_arctica.AAC.1